MPEAESAKIKKRHGFDKHRTTPSVAGETSLSKTGMEGIFPSIETLMGNGFSEATFQRHAALLGDPRMSRPMYSRQRAAIVRQIQRQYGNRYVQRVVDHIQRKRSEGVQTKLTVGPAGDKYEQEADRVAKQVVGMTEPSAQRQEELEEEEMAQTKPLVQRQVGVEGGDVEPDVERTIEKAHETTHVVQQGEGRVKPPLQAKGMAINSDSSLGKEAGAMRERAAKAAPPVSLRTTTSMIARQPTVQRVLTYKGVQYHTLKQFMKNDDIYKVYEALTNQKDVMAKLKNKAIVYDFPSLKETDDPVGQPPASGVQELQPVLGASLTGKSEQFVRAADDKKEMIRIQPLLAETTFNFNQSAKRHLPDPDGDGTSNIASTADAKQMIKGAVPSDLSGGGMGSNNGLIIRYKYDPDLSIVFEFFESDKRATVFHIGPGG